MRCPTCNQVVDPKRSGSLPFCGDRCRQIDLGRWLGEEYGLPVIPDPEEDEEPEDFSSPPREEE